MAYAHRLADEFSSRSISAAIARDYDLDETPVGATLLTALDLLDNPTINEDLQTLLDNPLVTPSLPDWNDVSTEQVYQPLSDTEEPDNIEQPYRDAAEALLTEAESVAADGSVDAYRTFISKLGIEETVESQATTGSQRVVYRSAERVLDAVDQTGDGDDLARARSIGM